MKNLLKSDVFEHTHLVTEEEGKHLIQIVLEAQSLLKWRQEGLIFSSFQEKS